MTEYDAKAVSVDIIMLLRSHWLSLPNEKTDQAVTSFQQNHLGPGLSEAIKVIADSYGIDITDPEAPQVKPT